MIAYTVITFQVEYLCTFVLSVPQQVCKERDLRLLHSRGLVFSPVRADFFSFQRLFASEGEGKGEKNGIIIDRVRVTRTRRRLEDLSLIGFWDPKRYLEEGSLLASQVRMYHIIIYLNKKLTHQYQLNIKYRIDFIYSYSTS